MNLHIPYSTPIRTDICVAFCFFNPAGYIRPLQNTILFQEKLRLAKIPYYSIEMVIDDKPPMLSNPTLRVRSKSSLFYKEALWNRLEKEIPLHYTKIAFLDSDVIFSEPDWLDKLSVLLDSCDLVHPFETVDRLNLAYEKIDTLISSVKEENVLGSGMGWAITRETHRALGGFFDKGILGNGDTLFYNCMAPEININKGQYFLVQDIFMAYRTNFQNVNPKVTYLDMKLYHLFHGTIKNRNYGNRHNEILGDIHTPWDSLFSLNADGFFELTENDLNKKMIEYFISRKEDSEEFDSIPRSTSIKPVTQPSLMNFPRPMLMKQLIKQEALKSQTPAPIKKPELPGKVYVPQRLNTLHRPILPPPIMPLAKLQSPMPLRYISTKRP